MPLMNLYKINCTTDSDEHYTRHVVAPTQAIAESMIENPSVISLETVLLEHGVLIAEEFLLKENE